jgi:hypothetical protein
MVKKDAQNVGLSRFKNMAKDKVFNNTDVVIASINL